MDEPTAALAEHEVELLYAIIRRLTERGVGVLYVSHRLQEIFDLCDLITVLKDGEQVATRAGRRARRGRAGAAHGRPPDVRRSSPTAAEGTEIGEPLLELRGAGNGYVDGVDLTIRAGEIVGSPGSRARAAPSCSRRSSASTPFTRGELRIAGGTVRTRSPRSAVRAGLALVTEDRKATGLALNQTILDNTLGVVRDVFPPAHRRRPRRGARPAAPPSRSPPGRWTRRCGFLSGGNQQKVVLATLAHHPPPRGRCWTSPPAASTSARSTRSTS